MDIIFKKKHYFTLCVLSFTLILFQLIFIGCGDDKKKGRGNRPAEVLTNSIFYGTYEIRTQVGLCDEETQTITLGNDQNRSEQDNYYYIPEESDNIIYTAENEDIAINVAGNQVSIERTGNGRIFNILVDFSSDFTTFTITGNASSDDPDDCTGDITGSGRVLPRLPDTGQTHKAADVFGEDSDYTINPLSYTKFDTDGNAIPDAVSEWAMVKDNVTGLMWEVKTEDGSIHDMNNQYVWQDIQNDFIDQLNDDLFGGYADWRLPSVRELVSLLDFNNRKVLIDDFYFPNIIDSDENGSAFYFSSDIWSTDNVWGVSFLDGYTDTSIDKRNDLNYVVAVRGESLGQDFIDNGDGTVTHTNTDLMWMQDISVVHYNFVEALSYCEDLDFAGYDDWRLPNIKELDSIVDRRRSHPAINYFFFYPNL